jgi:hypothetical protein
MGHVQALLVRTNACKQGRAILRVGHPMGLGLPLEQRPPHCRARSMSSLPSGEQ